MKQVVICILTLLLFCCAHNDSEMDVWHFGWRMTFNLMEGDEVLAVAQFDSLRALDVELDPQFLSAGMAAMLMVDREDEVEIMFAGLKEEVRRKVCQSNTIGAAPFCTGYSGSPPSDSMLSRELVQMYLNDQAVRGNLMEDLVDHYNLNPDSNLIARGVREVDLSNRERLTSIVEEHGFPTLELIGQDAMRGVFLIIQHADRDPDWQKAQLPLVEAAAKKGDLERKDYAYLYDRIQVNSNLPQRYGSQFANVDLVNGVAELAETEDPDNLDERRRSMGMMPIDMYRKLMLNIPQ